MGDAATPASSALYQAPLWRRATVWLAVTGLSRSGKTVFITSLVHNLLSSLHNPNRMPLLNVVGGGRLIAARLEGAKAQRLPRFPYPANIEKMAAKTRDRITGSLSFQLSAISFQLKRSTSRRLMADS